MSLTTTAPSAKRPAVVSLKYSPLSIAAALLALKGAEVGPATFDAVAPVFSSMIASGGSKAELSALTATAEVFKRLHSDTLKSSRARAWRATCIHALQDFTANGRAKDQDDHDARMVELSGMWCGFFKDAVKKPKDPTAETPAQKIARLEAELASVLIERDSLRAALAKKEAITA
jgi:hypothetical protein